MLSAAEALDAGWRGDECGVTHDCRNYFSADRGWMEIEADSNSATG